jgi:hypothetical protein
MDAALEVLGNLPPGTNPFSALQAVLAAQLRIIEPQWVIIVLYVQSGVFALCVARSLPQREASFSTLIAPRSLFALV